MILARAATSILAFAWLIGCTDRPAEPLAQATAQPSSCGIELIVLGAGQDAGAPQIGNASDPGWVDPALRLAATSIALVDSSNGNRYLFDATPQIIEQDQLLNTMTSLPVENLGLVGIFLTHAHIGHYTGLMFLGREAASTSEVPVYAMPRMANLLRTNGPWSQLVELGNIRIIDLEERTLVSPPNSGLTVEPYRVPHRDEYSETVGFRIQTAAKSALYLPDIDSWDDWETDFDIRLEDMITHVDFAFLDATFFDDNELPGRDMSLIPHPRVLTTMDRLQDLPPDIRARVHFIHYNHTNPIRFPASTETASVLERGFNIARAGDRHCLTER